VRQTTVHTPKQEPLRVTGEAAKHLWLLPQFHGIPDGSLIRLAKRRTGLNVPDRWVAIALILGNRVPIPVPPTQRTTTTKAEWSHGSCQARSDHRGTDSTVSAASSRIRRLFQSEQGSEIVNRRSSNSSRD
jgi:hypothetical protein